MNTATKILLDEAQIADRIAAWKQAGGDIVFTNGCFDILHDGHVCYLEEAKSLGKHLVVALNDDASVARLKGPTRPINALKQRMRVMAALASVDMVISFSEDTPIERIRLIMPDILVKGGDWPVTSIVGHEEVLAAGGQVKSLRFVDGSSTTDIEHKIIGRHTKSSI